MITKKRNTMEDKVKVWIARDEDGKLFAYLERPKKNVIYWWVNMASNTFELDRTKFPSVKWDDDEPTEAYITLAEPQEQPKQEQQMPKQEIDWEQRRYEIAKSILSAVHTRADNNLYFVTDDVGYAVNVADILIEKLKKGGER